MVDIPTEGKCLLFFMGPWCELCKVMKPAVHGAAEDVGIPLRTINVASQSPLAAQYGVHSIPQLILLKDGRVSKTTARGMGQEALRAWLIWD